MRAGLFYVAITMSEPRIARGKADQIRAILAQLDEQVRAVGLEQSLVELVRLRASQLNGCAYCIDVHTQDARANGETERRLYALSAWRDTPFFPARERAALEWTEAVTFIAAAGVPDSRFAEVRTQFSEEELLALTTAVIAINAWNRLAIAFRAPVGSYKRSAHQ